MIPNSAISQIIEPIKKYFRNKAFDNSATNKSIENDIDKAFDAFEWKLNLLLNQIFDDVLLKIEDKKTKLFLNSFDKDNMLNDMESKLSGIPNKEVFKSFLHNNIKNNDELNKLRNDLEVKLISFKLIFDKEKYNYIEWSVNKSLLFKERDKVVQTMNSNLMKSEQLLWNIIIEFFNDLRILFNWLPKEHKIMFEMNFINLKKILESKNNKIYYERFWKIIWDLFDDIVYLIT